MEVLQAFDGLWDGLESLRDHDTLELGDRVATGLLLEVLSPSTVIGIRGEAQIMAAHDVFTQVYISSEDDLCDCGEPVDPDDGILCIGCLANAHEFDRYDAQRKEDLLDADEDFERYGFFGEDGR